MILQWQKGYSIARKNLDLKDFYFNSLSKILWPSHIGSIFGLLYVYTLEALSSTVFFFGGGGNKTIFLSFKTQRAFM